MSHRRLEIVLTVAAFLTMIAGLVGDWQGAHPRFVLSMYVIAYIAGGYMGLTSAIEGLREFTIDIDLLMVLAALGAALVGAPFEGAMLLFLFSLSNTLQHFAIDRSRNAIQELMKLNPQQARVQREGAWVQVDAEAVRIGELVQVRPGDLVPLDGEVVAGESRVDQSSLTGESVPIPKKAGDPVFGGTFNENGALDIRVTRRAADSTIARLIQLVEVAQSEKAETQRFIDTAEQYYAIGVILFTGLAIAVPYFLLGEAFDPAFYRAMTLMVAASPCALVISTPATILSAIGNGARRGVLFKGGVYIEQGADIKAIAFDKTGTLTIGRRTVTDIELLPGTNGAWQGGEDELLAMAAALQSRSEHSLANATVDAARQRQLAVADAETFEAVAGLGVRGRVDGRSVRIGNARFFPNAGGDERAAALTALARLEAEGKTSVLVSAGQDEASERLVGVIAFADALRPEAANAVKALKRLGIAHIAMITGDNQAVAEAIGREAGVDAVYASQLPEEKMQVLDRLHETYGAVAMVGDGVNDAPALAKASMGIAMGAIGTDVALETADVVLMGDDLMLLPYLVELSRKARQTLYVNLGFALFMIIVMIISILTIELPLPLAVIGHEGSTVLVSLNGLRLLAFKGSRFEV
ncbi:MAG: heavy metal translocating P-type ATPase [Rhodothermales bacterium]